MSTDQPSAGEGLGERRTGRDVEHGAERNLEVSGTDPSGAERDTDPSGAERDTDLSGRDTDLPGRDAQRDAVSGSDISGAAGGTGRTTADGADDATPGSVDAASEEEALADGVLYDDEVTPEYGILGFTLRELLIVGAWALAFVTSFFPLSGVDGSSLWGQGIAWILTIGVPTAAVFLIVLRRFSPDGIRRVGSLGIDQFASVAFSVSAVLWLQYTWDLVARWSAGFAGGVMWVNWVQLIAMLALVACTVFAPLIPGLREDFHGRLVTLAHRNANPVRPVIPRPREERPVRPQHPAHPAPVVPGSATGQPHDVRGADAAVGTDAAESDAPTTVLDVELSGQSTTDEIQRLGLAEQVPLTAHASGGDTGSSTGVGGGDYVPGYARRSRGQDLVDDAGDDAAYSGASYSGNRDTAPRAESPLPAGEADLGYTEAPSSAPDASPATAVLSASDAATSQPAPAGTASGAAAGPASAGSAAVQPPAPAASPQPVSQPFWALAPTERDVYDDRGNPIFRVGPTAWVLVIEDRGGAFVVRHDDGRIGYLHDIADITRG